MSILKNKTLGKGFLAEKYALYQFDKNDSKKYFSDYHASMSRNINEPFNDLLTNKLVFSEIVGKVLKVQKHMVGFSMEYIIPKTN